jgi:hypothetical protein
LPVDVPPETTLVGFLARNRDVPAFQPPMPHAAGVAVPSCVSLNFSDLSPGGV